MSGVVDTPRWDAPEAVAGFVRAPPNATLLRFAEAECARAARPRALDLGCGAGRNAMPLARQGWAVTGLDLSWPMLRAAAHGARELPPGGLHLARAAMDRLGFRTASFDLVIAHGIWNLARSGAEFRRGVAEAARVAAPGAGLFVFTFSRSTLPPEAEPVAGETFVFAAPSGEPCCYLTREQLLAELAAAGFVADPAVPLTEHNVPAPRSVRLGAGPAIYEGAFRRRGSP